MNLNTAQIRKRIQQAVSTKNFEEIDQLIQDIRAVQRRKERKTHLSVVHAALKEVMFEEGLPDLLVYLGEVPFPEIQEVINRAVQLYIETRNEAWLTRTIQLCKSLERKNYQSKIFSVIAKDLIEAGVNEKDRQLIEKGMTILHMISFRKHRSSIMMDIIPMIIVWSVSTEDDRHLYTSLQLIDVIGDVSKRSILHSELAKAIGTIGILQRNLSVVREAVRIAIIIKQKQRRMSCVTHILERAWTSPLGKHLEDIVGAINLIGEIPQPRKYEILTILLEQLLNRVKDKKQIQHTLTVLEGQIPESVECIVRQLLRKAEMSGDKWFFERALEFNERIADSTRYPIREIVSSASVVVDRTGDIGLLLRIVPLLDVAAGTSSESFLSQYLLLSDTLLKRGEIRNAIEIFARIGGPRETANKNATETCVRILREGVVRDEIPLVKEKILAPMETGQRDLVISRSLADLCRDVQFPDLVQHLPSLQELAKEHSAPGAVIPECIRILIDRGFIESQDPSALLTLAERIPNRADREGIISAIVIGIAKVGVALKNRDLLQRAVGLSCEIQEQRPRSEALGHVIDQATILAVEQGDLDLLHRMMRWTGSLLDRDFKLYAIDSVIKGMITYGIHHRSPKALNEAYGITHTVEDPSLQQQQRESIIEGLIRVGCLRFTAAETPPTPDAMAFQVEPFEQALHLLMESVNRAQLSLKISKYVDIILEYSQKSNRIDFLIPLTMFILEIEESLERNAMFFRIVGTFSDVLESLDSTDPYEIIATVLQRLQSDHISPIVLNLIYRLLEQTPDSYKKFSALCNLADSYLAIKENERGRAILLWVHASRDTLTNPYEKALILSDLTGMLARVDESLAHSCLEQAQQLLDSIKGEHGSVVRRHIIFSIVSLHAITPREENVETALSLVEQIEDPVEYVNAFISILRMVIPGPRSRQILKSIYDAIARIPSIYERVEMLVSVVPMAEQYGEKGDPTRLLEQANGDIESISIPFISTMAKKGLVQVMQMVAFKRGDEAMTKWAREVASQIEDDTVRAQLLSQMGVDRREAQPGPIPQAFRSLREKIREGKNTMAEISAVTHLINSLPDRAKRARYYVDLYSLYLKAKDERVAERMLQAALDEASIIRPLSRRAFVLGDLALNVYSAGDEETSRDILGMAVYAAMNIREDELRDSIFHELDVALRIIEEHLA